MNSIKNLNIKILLVIILQFANSLALPPINLFRPADKMLIPNRWAYSKYQFTVGYEGAISIKGIIANDEEKDIEWCTRRVNPLQVYQPLQNGLAVLKGFDSESDAGQKAQMFNIDDDNGITNMYKLCGDFKVPVNLMLSARFLLPYGLTFGLHLPYYEMELKDIRYTNGNTDISFEQILSDDYNFLKDAESIGGISLSPWKRKGVGDLVAQLSYYIAYPQFRPILRQVGISLRPAVVIPTGKQADEDLLLAIPFGNDGSWGLQVGGGLDLNFGRYARGGFDVELLYLFGNTRLRRIQTDSTQTDLLFLKKVCAFKEYGLAQQYNLYFDLAYPNWGIIFRTNFQHLHQNENKLYLFSNSYNSVIANNAESLQDWSTNSLIFNFIYDSGFRAPLKGSNIFVTAWYKQGLVGKRALLANTLGFTIGGSF